MTKIRRAPVSISRVQIIGSVIVDKMYVDLPFAVVPDVGDIMYEDTLDPRIDIVCSACLCLPEAREF